MRILDRRPLDILRAPMEARHWQALVGLLRNVTPGPEALARYVTQRGRYPWKVGIATPTGPVTVSLQSRHDLLTVNEIFCRNDYGTSAPTLVVDVGANIGLATLFWLTRTASSRVWCYEPNPRNLERLCETLRGYEERVVVVAAAVGPEKGSARFFLEPTGRYGKLSQTGELEVEVLSLRDELARIERAEGRPPDLLKLDTEGTERELLASLGAACPEAFWEDNTGRVQHRDRCVE